MWKLIQDAIVYSLTLLSNIGAMLIFCDAFLKRRHSYKLVIIYITAKSLILNIGFKIFLADIMATNEIVNSIYLVLVTAAAAVTYIVFLYTFDEDFAKIAILCSAAEMVTMLIGCGVMVGANFITDDPLLSMTGHLHAVDFLMPIVTWTLTWLVIKIGKPLWKKLRTWEVKYKKVVMTAFFGYLTFSIVSMYMQFEQYIILLGIFWAIVWSFLLIGYVNCFHRKTMRENEALKKRQALAKMQYDAVVLEIERMEQMQKEIQTQMQTILSLSESVENQTEKIEKYIVDLKRHSETIMTGVYCDDWFLDSVLYYAKKKCEEKGIRADFYLQGYQKNLEKSEALADFVRQLLDKKIEKTKRELSLRVATVKGQIVIKICGDGKEEMELFPFDMQN